MALPAVLAGLIAVTLGATTAPAPATTAGQAKFQACAGCHGAAAHGHANAPKLGGQYSAYLRASMAAFAAGQRKHGTERVHTSEADAKDIAAYLAPLQGPTAHHTLRGNPERGKGKAESCEGCHGPGGAGDDPDNPRLAGQYEAYLVAALNQFKSGARHDDTMTPIAKTLTPADMLDLAAYFASQKRGLTLPAK